MAQKGPVQNTWAQYQGDFNKKMLKLHFYLEQKKVSYERL